MLDRCSIYSSFWWWWWWWWGAQWLVFLKTMQILNSYPSWNHLETIVNYLACLLVRHFGCAHIMTFGMAHLHPLQILVVLLKNIFFYLLNNISYKLDLKNQFLHKFFNDSLLWEGLVKKRKKLPNIIGA